MRAPGVVWLIVCVSVLLVQSAMAKYQNHYKVLQVPNSATTTEIKKAYRKMSREYHPDKHSGKTKAEIEEATLKFMQISKAHEILIDTNKRAIFDEDLELGLEQDDDDLPGGVGNIFERERRERMRHRAKQKAGFFGKFDGILSYFLPLYFIYNLFGAVRRGGMAGAGSGGVFANLVNGLGLGSILGRFVDTNNGPTNANPASGGNPRPACLPAGTRLQVHSLVSKPELNGAMGTIVSNKYDGAKQFVRYNVNIPKSSGGKSTLLALKPSNLRTETFKPSDYVTVVGLVNAKQHNGKIGTVVSFNEQKKRYNITLDNSTNHQTLALKYENLALALPRTT